MRLAHRFEARPGAPRVTPLAVLLCLVLVAAMALASCGPGEPEPAPVAAAPYEPTSTIKELMLSVVDPSADVVWQAVTAEMGPKGLLEFEPQSDEEWEKVRRGAVTLMEAANLLMVPGRRVARPGEKSETPGVELEPEEMDALIAKDRAAWNARARALHDVMIPIIRAIDARDAETVFNLGEQIEVTCESCHRQYWYPNEVIPELPPDLPVEGEP